MQDSTQKLPTSPTSTQTFFPGVQVDFAPTYPPEPKPEITAEPQYAVEFPQSPTFSQPPKAPFTGVVNTVPSVPSTAEPVLSPASQQNIEPVFSSKPQMLITYLLLMLLLLQGLWGFYSIMYFIVKEFPIFENALADAVIDTSSINALAIKVGLMVLSTALSFFFAVQITMFTHRMQKLLGLLSSAVVCVVTFFILQYAVNLGVV